MRSTTKPKVLKEDSNEIVDIRMTNTTLGMGEMP